MKRSRISRAVQILITLQAGKSYAVNDLSKMFGTSRRTIFHDLKELQAVGMPYRYDAKTGGYTIETEFFLPPEGRIYHIKLRFLSKVANNVAEVQWHSTQKVVHNSGSSATVEFRVDGLVEITWWILGYGDQIQVLAPKTLRKRILQIAKNMTELNEKI